MLMPQIICMTHSHYTRTSVYSFNIPYHKSHSKVGFGCNGIVLWNSLPKTKKYFLKKMFYQQKDFV